MNDDYKEEILSRLNNSYIFTTLKERCKEKDSEVIALVESGVSFAYQKTKTIIKHMGEYTLHDSDHLFRVLYLMERLMTEQVINNLSSPELMLLILSSFFHDIGMAPEEREVIVWRKIWDITPDVNEDWEIQKLNEFRRFYSAKPDQQLAIEQLEDAGEFSKADIIKSHLITEFIRQTHAERAREIIGQHWNEKIRYRDADLTVELAQICVGHNEDALKLLDLDKNYLCATDTVACLPLIGIILRLADILDFDAKRTPNVLYSHLYVRNPISISEWNKHRAIESWEISSELIQFSAQCKHPAIEASIHGFCDIIDQELNICNNIISVLNDFNHTRKREIHVKIPFRVNREKIKTKTDINNKPAYIYKDTKFTLSKKQVIDLLMGTKLYGNSEVALRELIQNSIDACKLRDAQEKKWGNLYEPEIHVRYYNEGNDTVLEVEDNGTGMDSDIIENYYSKVGASFYKSVDFYNLKSESNADFKPTSRFGIGILSCFMVADILQVDTKRVYAQHRSSEALNITVEGQESIFWIKSGNRSSPGTTTKLILRRTNNPWENMTEDDFIKSVENVIPNPPFKIHIETSSHKKLRDENSFSNMTTSVLKDYTWDEHENIKFIEIPLDHKEKGILGCATVAILERQGIPMSVIQLNKRNITIEFRSYPLQKKIRMSENSISETSTSITINDDGEIHDYNYPTELARSKSLISLHGIEIPTTVFPDAFKQRAGQVKISWPFPLILILDVCGNRDLDLNSPRTEIIKNEKWLKLEEELAQIICAAISRRVSKKYWKALKAIFVQTSKNEVFLSGLAKA